MSSVEEWWDILNAEGARTGDTFRRGAADRPSGSFHLIVAVCVQRDQDGAVLLTQRAADKKEFPFGWEFPGGSAFAGESSRHAASRELGEETRLDVAPAELKLMGRFAETSALLDFYVARVPSTAEVTLQLSEVMASEWVTPDEVLRRLEAGVLADPWIARLGALRPSAARALCNAR